jgi:hypothetical protein
MCPATYRGGTYWSEDRSCRDANLYEVVEAVIDDAMRVIDCEKIVTNEHLEHSY